LDHRLDQGLPIGVADHERHARGRRFALAGGMIEQKGVEVGEHGVEPGRARRNAEVEHRAGLYEANDRAAKAAPRLLPASMAPRTLTGRPTPRLGAFPAAIRRKA